MQLLGGPLAVIPRMAEEDVPKVRERRLLFDAFADWREGPHLGRRVQHGRTASRPSRAAGPDAAAPAAPAPAPRQQLPWHLPRYKVEIDLDMVSHVAHVRRQATWINPTAKPTQQLVFNAHSRYVVPSDEVGFMAETVEILRVQASDALGSYVK